MLVPSTDCYSDDRFNQDHDKKTGFRTNNMLAMPIKAGESCASLSRIARIEVHNGHLCERYAD